LTKKSELKEEKMFQFPDKAEKNSFEGELTWLFRVLNRENKDKAKKELKNWGTQ